MELGNQFKLLQFNLTVRAVYAVTCFSRIMTCASTCSRTNTTEAYATIPFYGNAIEVYGGTDVDHGSFIVSLDNGPNRTLNGSAPTPRVQVLLVSHQSC